MIEKHKCHNIDCPESSHETDICPRAISMSDYRIDRDELADNLGSLSENEGTTEILSDVRKLLDDDAAYDEICMSDDPMTNWAIGYLTGIAAALGITQFEYIERRLAEKQA